MSISLPVAELLERHAVKQGVAGSIHPERVYALTRVGTVLTRVARKRRGLVPEC